jgi:hypothetical protein
MGAIGNFFNSHPALRITSSREVDIAIFATLADIDLISGLHMDDMANADALLAAAKHKGNLPPDFSAKLEASMPRIWSQKKEHRVAYHPGTLLRRRDLNSIRIHRRDLSEMLARREA